MKMRFKCSHCSNRSLLEKIYDGELHCSHAECQNCGAHLILWYNADETLVVMIEDDY